MARIRTTVQNEAVIFPKIKGNHGKLISSRLKVNNFNKNIRIIDLPIDKVENMNIISL